MALCAAAFLTGVWAAPTAAQTPPGTPIVNEAVGVYAVGSIDTVVVTSNVVTITTQPLAALSSIELWRYAPGYGGATPILVGRTWFSTSGNASGPFQLLSPPVPAGSGAPLDLSQPQPLARTDVYHEGDPVFIRVQDADANRSATVIDTVLTYIHVDALDDDELLQLIETGPNTGEFFGYVQSIGGGPVLKNEGVLAVASEVMVVADYTDALDPSDTATASARVDPSGIVFDSRTGMPVNGARITLVDVSTGLPATVRGDDGTATFPATITSGADVTDGGGRLYSMSDGAYRFPNVVPGTYRIDVEAPVGYAAPSQVPTPILQGLPNGPFDISETASRNQPFTLDVAPGIGFDIPVDAAASELQVDKLAGQSVVSVGDFIEYTLRVQNVGTDLRPGVVVHDRLPFGFKYQTGSTRLDGQTVADPGISTDGRALAFTLGDMTPGSVVNVRYVLEVAAGTRSGDAVNRAEAIDGAGVRSNVALATTHVREDLFRTRNVLLGRVIANGCAHPESALGVPGVGIHLEDGTYTITDADGRYHFEGITSGTHIVQMDLASLPEGYTVVECEPTGRFTGRPFAQLVTLQGGTTWTVDFHLQADVEAAPVGEVGLRLSSGIAQQNLIYRVELHGHVVALDNLRLTLALPPGVTYIASSTRGDSIAIGEPEVLENLLVYRLGNVPAEWRQTFYLQGRVDPNAEPGDLLTLAYLVFDSPSGPGQRTEMVSNSLRFEHTERSIRKPDIVLHPRFATLSDVLSTEDMDALDVVVEDLRKRRILHMYVTGHTDSIGIAKRSQHIFPDNYALSLARARSVAEYLQRSLAPLEFGVTVDGRGPDEPVATNRTKEGRQENRRVELRLESEIIESTTSLANVEAQNGTITKTSGLGKSAPALESSSRRHAELLQHEDTSPRPPVADDAWLEAATPELEWIWPEADFSPPIPSLKIVVKHAPRARLTLVLNDRDVTARHFEGERRNKAGTVAVTTWSGVDLVEGDNRLAITVTDSIGGDTQQLERSVHYAGAPASVELVPERSALVADGRSYPAIAVRLRDRSNEPARPGVIGPYSVDPPYVTRFAVEQQQQRPLDQETARQQYRISEDGVAWIELQPTTQSGEVVVRFPFDGYEQEVRAWLEPPDRDWILVGLAEGTVGYNAVTGNAESLAESGVDEDYYNDGRVAFYAKGRVKGSWLLTMAFDSERDEDQVGNSLHQIIDPDAYYTLYGDATVQDYDAASARKVYVKLERRQFYALFGDFDTGLTLTELSRYGRRFNGFKTELRGSNHTLNAFVSETQHRFLRDELRGDGTSGLYRLSQPDIVINSESVVLETRDRFHSEVIVDSRRLLRHADYNIDYGDGTLYFREPIASHDAQINPVFIVVDYETRADVDGFYTAGGRAAVQALGRKLEFGSSVVSEDDPLGHSHLVGVDGRYRFGAATEVRGEWTLTDGDSRDQANAYLAEVTNRLGALSGRAYVRELQTGFGLGQQNRSELGVRKFGFDANVRLRPQLSLLGEAYRQTNLATDAERDVAEASVDGRWRSANLRLGGRYAADTFTGGPHLQSKQILAGAGVRTLQERMYVHVDHEQSLGDKGENTDFPTRTLLGVDYDVTNDVTVFAAQEFSQGENVETQDTRVGLRSTPWAGGRLTTAVRRDAGSESGSRVYANFGLRQTWRFGSHWSADGSIDHSRRVVTGSAPLPNPEVPPASGGEETFTAVSAGTAYHAEGWQWNTRLEYRAGESDDRWVILPSVFIEPSPRLGVAAGARIFLTQAESGFDSEHYDGRLAFSYRPDGRRWVFLDRLDLLRDETASTDGVVRMSRFVNNLSANRKFGIHTQLSLQYGSKWNTSWLGGRSVEGYTDLLGFELRHDFSDRMDIGLRHSMLHSWNAKQLEHGTGVSLGYSLFNNVWMLAGYNITGFRDDDLTDGAYTAHGPFLQFDLKADQVAAQLLGRRFFSSQPAPAPNGR